MNLSEVTVAYLLVHRGRGLLPDLFSRAGIATFAGLFCGNLVMVVIILVSGIHRVTQTFGQVRAGLSLIIVANLIVAVFEALLTGLIVSYIGKIRPDILGENTAKIQ